MVLLGLSFTPGDSDWAAMCGFSVLRLISYEQQYVKSFCLSAQINLETMNFKLSLCHRSKWVWLFESLKCACMYELFVRWIKTNKILTLIKWQFYQSQLHNDVERIQLKALMIISHFKNWCQNKNGLQIKKMEIDAVNCSEIWNDAKLTFSSGYFLFVCLFKELLPTCIK